MLRWEKVVLTFVLLEFFWEKKLSEVNNLPIGEDAPNLVTLHFGRVGKKFRIKKRASL
jgi:hypothetical protein